MAFFFFPLYFYPLPPSVLSQIPVLPILLSFHLTCLVKREPDEPGECSGAGGWLPGWGTQARFHDGAENQ